MEAIRSILREGLAKSVSTMIPLDRLALAWPIAAGHSIVAHSEVVAFEGEVCSVLCEREWIAHLQPMSENLRRKLEEVARIRVRALHFIQKP